METKTCAKCQETKPVSQFNTSTSGRTKQKYYRSRCKICQSIDNKEYRDRKSKEENAEYRLTYLQTEVGKLSWLKTKARRLGLDDIEVQKVVDHFNDHHGMCDICGRSPDHSYRKALCIDHCHDTNTFRGFLCMQCNMMLGYSYDNIETLKSAIAYLDRA